MTKQLSVNEIVAYENFNWREQGAHKYVHASDYAALELLCHAALDAKNNALTNNDGLCEQLTALEARCRDLQTSLEKYQACRVHDVDEKAWLSKRMTELEAAARQLLSLVQDKSLPHTDPANRKLFDAGDVILVNEGNLWNLLMVLGSTPSGGAADG